MGTLLTIFSKAPFSWVEQKRDSIDAVEVADDELVAPMSNVALNYALFKTHGYRYILPLFVKSVFIEVLGVYTTLRLIRDCPSRVGNFTLVGCETRRVVECGRMERWHWVAQLHDWHLQLT